MFAVLLSALLTSPVRPSAWEPTLDHVDAVCRQELATASSAPRGGVEWSNAWLAYLYCARNEIYRGLRQEDGNLLIGQRRPVVPHGCAEMRGVDVEVLRSNINWGLARAQQVNDFRTEAPGWLRSRIGTAGLAGRQTFEDVLEDLDDRTRIWPEGLTTAYLRELLAQRDRLERLADECPLVGTRAGEVAWVVECNGEIEIRTVGGNIESCRSGALVEPGSTVTLPNGGTRAKLAFLVQGLELLSVGLEPGTEVHLEELEVLYGQAQGEIALSSGLLNARAAADALLVVSVGSEAELVVCQLNSGTSAALAFDAATGRLTVDVQSGRVTAAGPLGPKSADQGGRLRFERGRAIP